MSAANEQISLTTRGKIAIITLNLPTKLNALTQDLYYRLSCLLREVAQRKDIYITVLTGKGRYFSAYAFPPPIPRFKPTTTTDPPKTAAPTSPSREPSPKTPTSAANRSRASYPTI